MTSIYDMSFPEELAGVDIDGIDVQMLTLDALRLLTYFARESDFTPKQYSVLQEIETDLPKVIEAVEEQHKKYFKKLAHAVQEAHHMYHQKVDKD